MTWNPESYFECTLLILSTAGKTTIWHLPNKRNSRASAHPHSIFVISFYSKPPFLQSMRATSTTEYVIILAVVLIIGIIAASLLGFFPGWGASAGEDAGRAKWAQQQPFAVIDSKAKPAGLDLVMQNNAADTARLRKVVVKPIGKDEKYATDANIVFEAGRRMTIGVNTPEGMPSGTQFGLEYCYTSADGIDTCGGDYGTPIPCADCDIPLCTIAGETCADNAECCSSLCDGSQCCIANGDFCSDSSQCCSQGASCNERPDGFGSVCCLGGIGAQCEMPSDCCQTAESSEPLACAQIGSQGPTACCMPDGASGCNGVNLNCCSNFCDGNTCMQPIPICGDEICNGEEDYETCQDDCGCLSQGMATQNPALCCPDITFFFNGYCRIESGSCNFPNECLSNDCTEENQCSTVCSQVGGHCLSATDCCGENACTGNTCMLGMGGCSGIGDYCATNANPDNGGCCQGYVCDINTPRYTCRCSENAEQCDSGNPDNGGCCANGYCSTFINPGFCRIINCVAPGGLCEVNAECCPGGRCDNNHCCYEEGMDCADSSYCCSESQYCVNGQCAASCGLDADGCASDSDCCSGFECSESTRTCTACTPRSGSCGSDLECCSGNCEQTTCICSLEGEPCGSSYDCCFGGLCRNGICGQAPPHIQCNEFSWCQNDAECQEYCPGTYTCSNPNGGYCKDSIPSG